MLNLLVEVFQELRACVLDGCRDLLFQLALQLVECRVDLFGRAAILNDLVDAFLEIHAGLQHAQTWTGPGSLAIMPMMRAKNFFASRSPIDVISVEDPGLKMAFQSTKLAAHQGRARIPA